MSIKINKLITEDVIHDDDSILTPLYGKIKIANNIDLNKYTYFDTFDGYDLFVSETANDTLAVKCESTDTSYNKVVQDIESIQSRYDVDIVKFDDINSTIIVKVLEDKTEVLDKIENEYANDATYEVKKITPQVLFLELVETTVKLEDDNPLNKLDDVSVKKLATDLGADSEDTKNKDSAMGFIKGKLASNKN